MANDITGINSAKTQQSGSRPGERLKNEAASAGSASAREAESAADKVSLTNTAAKLKDIERNLGEKSSVNAQRVQEVQSAIANGEYKVNAGRVADKMIDLESSLHQ